MEMGKEVHPLIVVCHRAGYGVELDGCRGECSQSGTAMQPLFAIGMQLHVKAGEVGTLHGQVFREGIVLAGMECQRRFGKQVAQGVVLELTVLHLPHRFAAEESGCP